MISDEIVFESLKEVTNWGILTTDAALTVTSVNRWFETNCGRPAGQILGGKPPTGRCSSRRELLRC
jgi:hypothetical protein